MKHLATSTVGRSRPKTLAAKYQSDLWSDGIVTAVRADALQVYKNWPTPDVIISDGAYGVLGFEGDTSDHLAIPDWYEPHVRAWSEAATPATTLWFWNSEIGWAAAHPILEKYGWRYMNANVWNKGKGHIAGNVNTSKIRRFPVVSEICVQYVFEASIKGAPLKKWLLSEWKRSGLPIRKANEACGVKDAATRKYFDQGHLWYFPPPQAFRMIQEYANEHGCLDGRPYYSIDGNHPISEIEWSRMRTVFKCPHGYTNVWERPALRGKERFRANVSGGRAVHLNQKPLDLMSLIIQASSEPQATVWEPFGGLFSASIAARNLQRAAFAAEIDPVYYSYGVQRLIEEGRQDHLL